LASVAFWGALLTAFLVLKWIAEAGMTLDAVRVQKERATRSPDGPDGPDGEEESEAAPDLRKVA
jgi:hypothetical protein